VDHVAGLRLLHLDPAHPRNQIIADIALAPRNRDGKVEFSADLFIPGLTYERSAT
jgi:hypothetical protein